MLRMVRVVAVLVASAVLLSSPGWVGAGDDYGSVVGERREATAGKVEGSKRERESFRPIPDGGPLAGPPLGAEPVPSHAVVPGRALSVGVDTVGVPGPPQYFRRANSVFRAPRAYASKGALVLEFDINPIERGRDDLPFLGYPARLLVRVFDENGQYLTHFVTTEYFCTDEKMVAWGKRYATDQQYVPVLLEPTANRLVYQLNQRDLDYAAKVEVGFLMPGG